MTVQKEEKTNYILMHKNIAVADIELDTGYGFITGIGNVYNTQHMPVGIRMYNGHPDRNDLNEWWIDRSIPASRSGIRAALEKMDIKDTKMLLTRCYGLSLSDHYWIKPCESDLIWDNINFFTNDFSSDIGDILMGSNRKNEALDFSSPDSTSDGNVNYSVIELPSI